MEQPKQINNTSERLVDDLKSRLSTQSRISIAAASFSIYAFEAMKAELEKVEEVRFIFTSPTFVADKTKKEKREFYIPKLNRERNLQVRSLKSSSATSCRKKLSPRSVRHGFGRK